MAAEALPARISDAQRAVAEIRGISVATLSELRSTVRRLRSLESVVELPAGLEDGYLLKDAEPDDLREAIRVVAAGGVRTRLPDCDRSFSGG